MREYGCPKITEWGVVKMALGYEKRVAHGIMATHGIMPCELAPNENGGVG
jgi:hypothetical protein